MNRNEFKARTYVYRDWGILQCFAGFVRHERADLAGVTWAGDLRMVVAQ